MGFLTEIDSLNVGFLVFADSELLALLTTVLPACPTVLRVNQTPYGVFGDSQTVWMDLSRLNPKLTEK